MGILFCSTTHSKDFFVLHGTEWESHLDAFCTTNKFCTLKAALCYLEGFCLLACYNTTILPLANPKYSYLNSSHNFLHCYCIRGNIIICFDIVGVIGMSYSAGSSLRRVSSFRKLKNGIQMVLKSASWPFGKCFAISYWTIALLLGTGSKEKKFKFQATLTWKKVGNQQDQVSKIYLYSFVMIPQIKAASVTLWTSKNI